MDAPGSLSRLETVEGYRESFMDPCLWRPWIEQAGREHGWKCERLRAGKAGTFPTFIVDEERVVKFYGPLFEGKTCMRVELECAQLLSGRKELPLARIITFGELTGAGNWDYLVFEFIDGVAIGECYTQLPEDQKHRLARQAAKWLRVLHGTKVPRESSLPCLDADRMRRWFEIRRRETLNHWPEHLGKQLDGYLNSHAEYLQAGCDIFIHADLTQDHLLGRLRNGRWKTQAIIDFGDAMKGNFIYELAALHLDLFDSDRGILATFIEEYGLWPGPGFTCKAMVTTLLHQFDVYGPLFDWKPELKEMSTIDELADRLWNVE